MRSVFQDLGYFARTVVKAPGFFAVAVLTLALGIGANTAIFSVINSVLLRPLPFHEPDRLVRLFETEAAPGRYPFTGPDYLDWQAQNRTLESSALFTWYRRSNVSGGAQPESATTVNTEVTFFDVLGVPPLIGRTFSRADASGERVAILSYGFWQRHFGGDPAVINRRVELDAQSHVIVGVMPSWFNYPRGTEAWTPLDMAPANLGPRGSHSYLAIARLKPRVSVDQAQADLALIARRLEQQYPGSNEKVGAAVVSMKEQLTSSSREPLLILLGAVALVLLVACANVANLLLIRAGSRRRELSIRSALGAGRARVVRQLLTESVVLALTGGAAGLAAAWWGVRLLRSVKTLPIPVVNPVRIDLSVLLFTLTAALLTGVLFGILPALQASGLGISEELKSSGQAVLGTGTRTRRLRDAIAVAEMAVSLALLVGAGLLLRSFDNLRTADIGANPLHVLTAGINLPTAKYSSPVTQRAFFDRLLERLRTVPGLHAASLCTAVPLEGGSNGYITVPGQDNGRLKNQLFEWDYVSSDYFRVFAIPLLEGRGFGVRDEDQAAEVARKANDAFASVPPQLDKLKGLGWSVLVNRSMARLVWPNENAIGKTFVMGGVLTAQVIGVVGDVKAHGIRSKASPQAYIPFNGSLSGRGGFQHLAVKTAGAPMAALASIRAQLNGIDPGLAMVEPRTMEDVIADGMADTALQTWLLGAFAALAATLAGVGLYSVMAFLVAQRKHEIGIRTALGARRADLLRLVLGHAAKLTAVGVVVGLAGAFSLTRLMRTLLFGVESNDFATFALVSCLVVFVALMACAIPARRATRVNPLVALRYE